MPLDFIDFFQFSIKNNEYKNHLLIYSLLLIGLNYFMWIVLLANFIIFSQYRNFIYLFIIYILIEKAIYCASKGQKKAI